jgi:hypothetical protein
MDNTETKNKKVIDILPFGSNMWFVLDDLIIKFNSYVLPKIDYWNKIIESYNKNKEAGEEIIIASKWNSDALCYILASYAENADIKPICGCRNPSLKLRLEVYKIAHEINDTVMRKIATGINKNENEEFWPTDRVILHNILNIKNISSDCKKILKNKNDDYITVSEFRETQKTDVGNLEIIHTMYSMETDAFIKNQLQTLIATAIYYSEHSSEHFKFLDAEIFKCYKEFENFVS